MDYCVLESLMIAISVVVSENSHIGGLTLKSYYGESFSTI